MSAFSNFSFNFLPTVNIFTPVIKQIIGKPAYFFKFSNILHNPMAFCLSTEILIAFLVPLRSAKTLL